MSGRISPEDPGAFAIAALAAAGVPAEQAAITADALATTDAMGDLTHGTIFQAGHLKKLKGGGFSPGATSQIMRQGPARDVIEGHSCLGQFGCDTAVKIAIDKARATGVAYVGLIDTGHLGAAGHFAAQAARHGFIAMITGSDIPGVAAPGSRKAVPGSNPRALAVPVTGRDPILLDIATAAVAGGRVYGAIQRGEPIPPTWLIGPDGHPTADGTLDPDHVALAPMARYKGLGLGLWREVLSAIPPCGRTTWRVGYWIFDKPEKNSGHNASVKLSVLDAIAPPRESGTRLARVIEEIHQVPAADGIDQVLLPGEREWANLHESARTGIALPPDVLAELGGAATITGVSAPWPGARSG